jgi:hypothetical protein
MCARDQRQGRSTEVTWSRACLCTRRAGIRDIIVDTGCSTVTGYRHGNGRSHRVAIGDLTVRIRGQIEIGLLIAVLRAVRRAS